MLYRLLGLRTLAFRAALVALGCAAGGGAAAQDGGPLRVGFICPTTGGSADFGNSARLGAELAAREINEVGGFLGRKIELVQRDDQANPDRGRQVAEGLVLKEKVAFTIGFCNTGVAMKALDVFQDNQHLLMVPVSTGSAVTAKYPAAQSFIFRMSPRDTLQAGFIVNDILVKRGLTKVAVFADRTGYGEGGLKDVLRFLAERGVEPVLVSRFDLGVTSLLAEVQQAKATGAQAVIGYTVGPELAVLARARNEARYDGLLYGPWPMSFRTVWERSNGGAEGAMMVQSIIPNLANERRSSFIARLKRHAGKEPVASLMAAAQTYDALHLMLRALFQTRGDTSAVKLKQALEQLDKPYVGVVTTYEHPFSANDHDAISTNMIWLGVWRKGEIRFQYAEDDKRAGFIRRKEGP
ncbi:ABC transporter substrate-binding protein [Aquabacterium sp.]|uniref:ABC transporter substrate-binding protein n=1 Tax=Aquabacterium sp. TaxID=1872578 RepID=UPI002B755E6A|nr:ABC transporter substrate-binding protein [Aquabacterium sp.]HSW08279.1 ABC transporter substrate-binding protein [Aquabacterium sp.]